MKLYHVTRRDNLPSILADGLDPERARGKRKSVWGVTAGQVQWALVHVLAKPWNRDARLSDLVVIELSLPRSAVRRYHRTIWYTVPGHGSIPVTEAMLRDPADYGKAR